MKVLSYQLMRCFVILIVLWTTNLYSQEVTIPTGTKDLDRYTIFLHGEFHDRPIESERSFLTLAKHLYKNNNVRHLVFEFGPDFSFLANRYLQTEKDSLLFGNVLWYSKSFWDSVIEINKNKVEADKLKVSGFDFNRSIFTAKAFSEMINNKGKFPDPAFQSALEQIIAWNNVKWTWEGQSIFVQQMKKLQALSKTRSQLIHNYFGENVASFLAIVNHDVDSKPTVNRDKKGLKYVKHFLNTINLESALFNYGISHTFLNGVGMGKLLNDDSLYHGKVCSIYPYYRIPVNEQTPVQQVKNSYLPNYLLMEMESSDPYSLINLEKREIYPREIKISQWVYVIPKAELQ